jgi:hypothetical protein
MERLAEEFADIASFHTVWVREPHAGGDYPQPETIEQRQQYARDFVASDGATITVLVDDMDATIQRLMGGFPNSVYVIDVRGRVAYRAGWTDHREIRRILERQRVIADRVEAGQYLGIPRWSEELTPALTDDPDAEFVRSIEVWEEAKNYGEPERFLGPERAERFRSAYERITGRASIRPSADDA